MYITNLIIMLAPIGVFGLIIKAVHHSGTSIIPSIGVYMLTILIGLLTHRRFRGFNELRIDGSDIIKNLPDKNVLFVSNHQTYFADVVSMFHVFNASLKGRVDSIKNIGYIWNPKLNLYFIAAKETMRSGLLPRILAYAGSVSIERTWRSKGEDINRQVKMSDVSKIGVALNDGTWFFKVSVKSPLPCFLNSISAKPSIGEGDFIEVLPAALVPVTNTIEDSRASTESVKSNVAVAPSETVTDKVPDSYPIY